MSASPSPSVPDPGTDSGTDPGSVLRRLSELVRPVTFARERTLPVLEPLAPLLPDGVLTRGSLVRVGGVGATSLALSLMAAASGDGSWAAVIGLPELGLVAAAEHGLMLDRLALIDAPPTRRSAELIAAVLDGIDLVLLDSRVPISGMESRRIAARLRERGSVLITVEPASSMGRVKAPHSSMSQAAGGWSPDLVLMVGASQWQGLGQGNGMLCRRRVHVEASGRGRAARPRHLEVLLPAEQGRVESLRPDPSSITTMPTRSGCVAG